MSNKDQSHNRISGKDAFITCVISIILAIFISILLFIDTWFSNLLLVVILLGIVFGVYWLYKISDLEFKKMLKNQEDENKIDVIHQQPTAYFLQYQQLISNYQHLQSQSLRHLGQNAQNKLTKIEEIMQFMNEKLQQSQDESFQNEIMDIQRTLNAYLSPALQHFIDIPEFLRNRKVLDQQQTPNQIIEQQLQMIVNEFENIAESIYLNDLNQLVDHGQFLKYKLQQPDLFKMQQDISDHSA